MLHEGLPEFSNVDICLYHVIVNACVNVTETAYQTPISYRVIVTDLCQEIIFYNKPTNTMLIPVRIIMNAVVNHVDEISCNVVVRQLLLKLTIDTIERHEAAQMGVKIS